MATAVLPGGYRGGVQALILNKVTREQTAAFACTRNEGTGLPVGTAACLKMTGYLGDSRWRSPVRILNLAEKRGLFQPPLLPYLTWTLCQAWSSADSQQQLQDPIWILQCNCTCGFQRWFMCISNEKGEKHSWEFSWRKGDSYSLSLTPFGCVIVTNFNSEMATGMNRISLLFLNRLPK